MKLNNFLTKDTWTQGWYARNENDEERHCLDRDATKFSLMGALIKIYPESKEYLDCQDRLASLIRIMSGQRIEDFNDTAEWEDIERLLGIIDL